MDQLVTLGGAVKALGAGRVGGYLVVFGSPEQTDVSALRDFFTPETDFDMGETKSSSIYYAHGLEPAIKGRKLGEGSLKVDEIGVWVEGQLALRDAYEKAIYELAEAGKLGWSSGTASHLVERRAIKGEGEQVVAHEITRWPLGLDASLTPTPAEPRTAAVALKSLPPPPPLSPEVKAEYLGAWIEQDMTMAMLARLNDALMWNVVQPCFVSDEPIPERVEKLRAGVAEFSAILLRTVEQMLHDEAGESADDAAKAILSLWADPAGSHTAIRLPASLRIEEQGQAVLEAARGYCERVQGVKVLREAKGGSLSAARRADVEALKALCDTLLSPPPAQAADVDRAASQFAALQARLNGVPLS